MASPIATATAAGIAVITAATCPGTATHATTMIAILTNQPTTPLAADTQCVPLAGDTDHTGAVPGLGHSPRGCLGHLLASEAEQADISIGVGGDQVLPRH